MGWDGGKEGGGGFDGSGIARPCAYQEVVVRDRHRVRRALLLPRMFLVHAAAAPIDSVSIRRWVFPLPVARDLNAFRLDFSQPPLHPRHLACTFSGIHCGGRAPGLFQYPGV